MRKRILVFGDSNAWGFVPAVERRPLERYPEGVPWVDALSARLGNGVAVQVDAVPARTTDQDDAVSAEIFTPLRAHDFNGLTHLPAALVKATPADLVILALGTNDLKARFDRSAEAIARSVIGLADMVRTGGAASAYPSPAVLILAPAPIGSLAPWTAESFSGREGVGQALGPAVAAAAEVAGVPVVEAGVVIGRTHGCDGIHFTEADHAALAQALGVRVEALLRGTRS
ncbi:hydrolase [Roseospira marina]|uniref:Hydrolase n=1 Tax=Roseospira marina TaxID=140057 RepID=A0A5M6IGW0_9PROT|nr:GDSL-type esterase/lipase family protein [Roseospira marina]KAA5607464.1 hydrolase [Roseospira marina]MBB4312356.1 lysophospholipase L1-like esterase [Roseospira marina]MBB5085628.1 lysophospholipase L1-like esterase [Roseospira marina]